LKNPLSVCSAFDVFIQAYARLFQAIPGTRLLKSGEISYLHFGEPLDHASYEFMACGMQPCDAAGSILEHFPLAAHWLTMAVPQARLAWNELAPLKYKPHDTEYVMTLDVENADRKLGNWSVHAVSTPAEIQDVNNLRDRQVLTPIQVEDPQIRSYVIRSEDTTACYGTMVYGMMEGVYYIANLYTHPDHRKQGMGAAILQRMFADALESGYSRAVLLSTEAGHALYRQMGFQDLSEVAILFYPGRVSQEED